MATAKAVLCDWFLFMMSFPRTQPLTNTQTFAQWSSVLAYCGSGASLLACPQLWKFVLQLHFEGRTEGYLRLFGLGVLIIGFILGISARSNYQVPKHGPILGSILARFLYVNGIVLMLILRNMLPISFGLVFMALDTLLALITLVIYGTVRQKEPRWAFSSETFFCKSSSSVVLHQEVLSRQSFASGCFRCSSGSCLL